MSDELSGSIPGVSQAEIVGAMSVLANVPESSLNDKDRFGIEVRSIVEARAQAGWQGEGSDDVAVFLMVPYPRSVGEAFGASPTFDLKANGKAILGKIFFLNRDASSGREMPIPCDANAILEWISDKKLGTFPNLIAYRGTKSLVGRPLGTCGHTRTDVIRDVPPKATAEELKEAMALNHQEVLLTPSVCPEGVWKKGKANQYIPGVAPEKAIQKALRIALTSWFRGVVKAEVEDSISVGRIDIRLLRLEDDGRYSYWAILELKVIKSFHHPDGNKKAKPVEARENAEAIAEGVRQARSFGKNRSADPYLDIFDLRRDKTDEVLKYQIVTEELGKGDPKPICHVWPIFGSASDARLAGWPQSF